MVRRAERRSSQNQKGFFSNVRKRFGLKKKTPIKTPVSQETSLPLPNRDNRTDTRVYLLASEDRSLPKKSDQLFLGGKTNLSLIGDADPEKQKKAFEALSKKPQEKHDKFIKIAFENVAKDSNSTNLIKQVKSALNQLDAKEAKKVVGNANNILLFERPNFLRQIKHDSSGKLGEIQQELKRNLANLERNLYNVDLDLAIKNSSLDKEEAPTRERTELMLKILEAKERLEIVNIMSHKGTSWVDNRTFIGTNKPT